MQPTPLERTTIKLLSLSLVPLEPRSTFSSYSSTSSASSSSSSSQISPHTTSFLSTPSPYTTHTRSSTSTIPQTPESISQRREKPKSLWRNPFLNNAGTKENAGNARGERDGKETAVLPSPPISPTTIVTARTATKVCREEIGIVRVGRGKMVRDRPHTHTHSAPFTLPLSSQDILFGEEQDLGFPFGHIVRSGESGMGRGRSLGSVGDQGTKLKDGDEEGEAKDLFALPSSPLLGDLEPHPGTLVDFFSGTRAANQTEPDGAKDGDAAEDSEQKIEMQERRHMLWEYHRFLKGVSATDLSLERGGMEGGMKRNRSMTSGLGLMVPLKSSVDKGVGSASRNADADVDYKAAKLYHHHHHHRRRRRLSLSAHEHTGRESSEGNINPGEANELQVRETERRKSSGAGGGRKISCESCDCKGRFLNSLRASFEARALGETQSAYGIFVDECERGFLGGGGI